MIITLYFLLILNVRHSFSKATRRGAGIPFLVQAQIVSEPSTSGSPRPNVERTMTSLLSAARESDDDDVRVLASNILRSLFRNNRLGSDVRAHVEEGMAVALSGFKAASWKVS